MRGIHYLKIGRKPVIVREAFIKYLKEVDHGYTNS